MVSGADFTQSCIRLEQDYQGEVTKLYYLTQDGVNRIKFEPSARREEYRKWCAQLKEVQGLHRQLRAMLKEMGKRTCYSNQC